MVFIYTLEHLNTEIVICVPSTKYFKYITNIYFPYLKSNTPITQIMKKMKRGHKIISIPNLPTKE